MNESGRYLGINGETFIAEMLFYISRMPRSSSLIANGSTRAVYMTVIIDVKTLHLDRNHTMYTWNTKGSNLGRTIKNQLKRNWIMPELITKHKIGDT